MKIDIYLEKLIQQEDLTDISELDYQDTTDPSTTWTVQ